ALRDRNRPAEGAEIEHGAAVAEGAAQRVTAGGAAARREREIAGADLSGERARVDFESCVPGEGDADVSREALQLVTAVLHQRARQRDVGAGRARVHAL